MSIPQGSSVLIREVWAHNLEEEFLNIRNIVDDYPYVAIDTEYPGVVFNNSRTSQHTPTSRSSSSSGYSNYASLKQNVDNLNLIQLGLTFTNAEGRLPPLPRGRGENGAESSLCAWQFNFREFDVRSDLHAPCSIELLRDCGMDFDKNRSLGVDASTFGELLMASGVVLNRDHVKFLSFHGAYDFAYLLKILTGKELPARETDFMALVGMYFGPTYDVKHLMHVCGASHGGLNRLAQDLGLKRYGVSHQAGSDSLLTASAFHKLRDAHFNSSDEAVLCKNSLQECCGVLYGLGLLLEPASERKGRTSCPQPSTVGNIWFEFFNTKQPIMVY